MQLALGYASTSQNGQVNTDAIGAFDMDGRTLLVVCDGQGSPSSARQAAQLAIEVLYGAVRNTTQTPEVALHDGIELANRAIYEEAKKNHRLIGVTSSIAAVYIDGSRAVLAHVGNCRVYMFRGDEEHCLTRDHTMVNMFIDNELLSAEDAESHPEAHVLSRSLGGERQVEIELQEVDLLDGDVLALSSDGVHRCLRTILEDNWTDPDRSAREILQAVEKQRGTDAASIVGVRIGGSGTSGMPPMPPVSVEHSGDAPTPLSMDEVRSPELLGESRHRSPFPTPDRPSAQISVPSPEAAPDPASTTRASLPFPDRVRTSGSGVPPTPPASKSRIVMMAGIAAIGVSVLLIGGAWIARSMLDTTSSNSSFAPDARSEAQAIAPPMNDVATPPVERQPDTIPDTRAVELVEPGEVDITRAPGEFARIAFPPNRRNQRSPQAYTHALPSPAPRIQISHELGRKRGCSQIERIVKDAMQESGAYAPLYRDLWNCFHDLHDPYVGGTIPTPLHFADKRPHLEGALTQPDPAKPVPLWFVPASDGIERRMDLFAHAPEEPDSFHAVIVDAFDADFLAVRFHYDLIAQAAYAHAFSRLSNPTADQIQDWARRVYSTRRHLDSAAGALVLKERPSAHKRIADLVSAATFDFEAKHARAVAEWVGGSLDRKPQAFDWRGLAQQQQLPLPVAQAVLVGAGKLPPPDEEPKATSADASQRPMVSRDPCVVNPADPRCIP